MLVLVMSYATFISGIVLLSVVARCNSLFIGSTWGWMMFCTVMTFITSFAAALASTLKHFTEVESANYKMVGALHASTVLFSTLFWISWCIWGAASFQGGVQTAFGVITMFLGLLSAAFAFKCPEDEVQGNFGSGGSPEASPDAEPVKADVVEA